VHGSKSANDTTLGESRGAVRGRKEKEKARNDDKRNKSSDMILLQALTACATFLTKVHFSPDRASSQTCAGRKKGKRERSNAKEGFCDQK